VAADGPQDLETAVVSAQQQATGALAQDVGDDVLAVDGDVETVRLVVQQVDAVQDGGAEDEEMAGDIEDARPAPQCSGQIGAGGGAGLGVGDQEAQADRRDQRTAERAAKRARDPDRSAQVGDGAELSARAPGGGCRGGQDGGNGSLKAPETTTSSVLASRPSKRKNLSSFRTPNTIV
jgi:hypothetical protein